MQEKQQSIEDLLKLGDSSDSDKPIRMFIIRRTSEQASPIDELNALLAQANGSTPSDEEMVSQFEEELINDFINELQTKVNEDDEEEEVLDRSHIDELMAESGLSQNLPEDTEEPEDLTLLRKDNESIAVPSVDDRDPVDFYDAYLHPYVVAYIKY